MNKFLKNTVAILSNALLLLLYECIALFIWLSTPVHGTLVVGGQFIVDIVAIPLVFSIFNYYFFKRNNLTAWLIFPIMAFVALTAALLHYLNWGMHCAKYNTSNWDCLADPDGLTIMLLIIESLVGLILSLIFAAIVYKKIKSITK